MIHMVQFLVLVPGEPKNETVAIGPWPTEARALEWAVRHFTEPVLMPVIDPSNYRTSSDNLPAAEPVTHLWEIDHPYYAEEGNYYSSRDCHDEFESWSDFKESGVFDADRDMNLIYRWDWYKHDPADYELPDVMPEGVTLKIYIMGQRKARACSQFITVTEADEPEIRAWLIECAKTITAIWAPIQL